MKCEPLAAIEAFGVAARMELDAIELYTELAARIHNQFLRRRLLLVASEEVEHKRILDEAYQKQFPDIPFGIAPHRLPVAISSKTQRDALPIKDLLFHAVNEERKARDLYLDSERQVQDAATRAVFRFLAEWEFSHEIQVMLDCELVAHYPKYFEEA